MTKPIRILHFEDDPADAGRFRDYLAKSKKDYRIDVAECLSGGLSLLEAGPYDVILLDLGLSDCQGIECLRRVKSQVQDVPIIVLNGIKDEKLATQAVHEGAQDYLIKDDINARALARAVDYAIERTHCERRILDLNRLLRSTQHINHLIIREKDEATLLQEACNILHAAAGFSIVWIGLLEESGPRIRPVAAAGLEMDFLRKHTITTDDKPTGRGPSGTVVGSKKTCVFADLNDKRFAPWRDSIQSLGITSCVASPLLIDDTVFGVLNVYSQGPDILEDDEIALVEEIGVDLAFGVSMIRMGQQQARMAEALSDGEEQYRTLIDNLNDVIFNVDGDGQITYISPIVTQMSGYTPEEIVGKHFTSFLDGQEARIVSGHFEDLMSGRAAFFEIALKDKLDNDHCYRISSRLQYRAGEVVGISGVMSDITETRRAQEVLREQAEILDQIHDIVITTDLEGAVTSWNKGAQRLIGYRAEEMVGRPISLIYPEREYEATRKRTIDGLRGNGEIRDEFTVQRKDGSEFPVHLTLALRRNKDGKTTGLIGSAVDITERKKAEETLRQSRETYRAMFEDTRAVMLLIEPETGHIIDANKAACEFYGYSKERLLEMVIMDINTLSEHEIKEEMARARAGKKNLFSFRHRISSGEVRDVDVYSGSISVNGRTLLFSIIHDVTEPKKAEEALRESEERYRLLAENANDIIFTIDTNLKTTYASPSVMKVRGFTAEEAMAQTPAEALTPDSLALAMEVLGEELEIEKRPDKKLDRTRVLELEETCKDGSTIWTETTFSILRDKQDSLTGFLGITRDISERKKAEQAQRESEAKYRELMENSIDVVFLIDKRGVFTEVNDAFLDEGNYRRKDVIGKDFSFMVHPDDAPIAIDAFQQGLRGEPSKFEMRARKRDGRFNWYSFINRPILDSSGATVSIHGIARNITERKEAEEALRERERQLSAVTESLTGPVSRVDRDLRYLYANSAYERWHGRSPQAIMGLTIREVIGDEGFRKAEPYLKRALAGERVTFEGPVESPAGDVIYGLVTYVPDVNSEGKVEGLFIIVTDITERKKAEEALRTSEEKYRVVVENGNEAILVAQDNMLKFVNPQTERHSGYSSEELLGKPFIEFVHPEDRDALIQRYKERLAGKPAAHPARFRVNHKNGEIRWAETEVVTIDWEGRPATLVFAHDITEQRRAAEALRESEDRFRTLFESSKDAILIVAAAGEIVAINSAGRDLFGYTEEEIASINAMDFYVNPDDRDRFRRRIETQGYTKDFEITYRKKDGTLVECLETATVVRDSEGRVVGYQGAIRDVTEHKRMEHRLIQAEKLSSLGGMISGVAHELNNPLTSIIGNAQLLMRKEILPDFRNKLEVIQSESVRCTKIVGGLLSFAREHKPERRMIDVNTVLMESLRLREYDLKVNNVHVDTKLADDLPETSADPYQLQQVFINLINNSHDALREKGGGTLSIRSSFKDDFVRVVFTDDGPGIEPGNLNRIFDPFFTTKDVGKGTGLGLSIAYGIIHEHGGTIDAESRPGKGSLFTIRIPIVQQNDPAEQDEEAPSSKKPVRKRGILIVEDEESLGKFISEALVEEGYSVRTVSRGEEAIELLKVLRFDLIITDLKMPGVGGKELYTYIRKHVPNLADRVLFMTGDVLGKDTQRFLEITGNPCIEKPFDLARLFMMISEIFGKQD